MNYFGIHKVMWKRKRHGLSLTTITCFTLAENWKCGWSRHISSSVQVHWLLIQGRNSIQQPVAIPGNEAFHRMTGNSMETFKCHQILLVHVGVLSSLSFSTHPPTCMCADIHIYIAMDTLLFLSEISGIPLCPSPQHINVYILRAVKATSETLPLTQVS